MSSFKQRRPIRFSTKRPKHYFRGYSHLIRYLFVTAFIFMFLVLSVFVARHNAGHAPEVDWDIASFTEAPGLEDIQRTSLTVGGINDTMLYRPDGHGGEVRVLILFLSTKVNAMLCHAVASAYFSGVPVVVVGFDAISFKPINKWAVFANAVEWAGLAPSDVVLPLDTDVLLSGESLLPYIDRFICLSAPSPLLVDVRAVREGRAMAASTFGTEEFCYSPQFSGISRNVCKWNYNSVAEEIKAYYDTHGMDSKILAEHGESSARRYYINSGTSIHRVWALRALNEALTRFMAQHKPADGGTKWNCDQSVVIGLYHNLRLMETHAAAYVTTTKPRQRVVYSTYGVPMGMIGIDISDELSNLYLDQYLPQLVSDSKLWRSKATKSRVVDQWYRPDKTSSTTKAHKTCQSVDNVECRANTSVVADAALRRTDDEASDPVRAVLPLLLHCAGGDKMRRVKDLLAYLPWYMQMVEDRKMWKQSRDYLLSMPMELWSTTRRARVRYADVCPQHPFSVPPTWD